MFKAHCVGAAEPDVKPSQPPSKHTCFYDRLVRQVQNHSGGTPLFRESSL